MSVPTKLDDGSAGKTVHNKNDITACCLSAEEELCANDWEVCKLLFHFVCSMSSLMHHISDWRQVLGVRSHTEQNKTTVLRSGG
jgi:hypothetical protein